MRALSWLIQPVLATAADSPIPAEGALRCGPANLLILFRMLRPGNGRMLCNVHTALFSDACVISGGTKACGCHANLRCGPHARPRSEGVRVFLLFQKTGLEDVVHANSCRQRWQFLSCQYSDSLLS
jgi:hypothetical protein